MMVASSPGRPEKMVAPPFARLLRGKGGSRSRGRSLSRSSPMFVIRRRVNGSSSAAAEIQDARDPGSPKVTCIGQVRIKKKKKVMKKNKIQIDSARSSSSTGNRQQSKVKKEKDDRHFVCVRCFHPLAKVVRSRVWLMWRRWLSCSGAEEKMVSKEEDARGLDLGNGSMDLGRFPRRRAEVVTEAGVDVVAPGKEIEDARKEEKEAFVLMEPPKNALLLMRCRSAPHRSAAHMSAVAEEGLWNPARNRGGKDRKMAADDRKEQQRQDTNSPLSKEEGSSCCDESSREDNEEDEAAAAAVGPTPSFSSRPLILSRCKSEPAKKAARLAAVESSFLWGSGNSVSGSGKNKKWLAFADESSPK